VLFGELLMITLWKQELSTGLTTNLLNVFGDARSSCWFFGEFLAVLWMDVNAI
jgi:hypothetical protein